MTQSTKMDGGSGDSLGEKLRLVRELLPDAFSD